MVEKENAQFLRRVLFLASFQFICVMILLGRMYYLQIIEGPYYHLLAEGNRITTRPLLPARGQLYDRQGLPLAQNETSFRALLLADKKDKVEETLENLSTLISLTPKEKEDTLRVVKKKGWLDALILKEDLSWEEVSAIELYTADLPGISVEIGSLRCYPEKHIGAHLIGYVAAPSEKDQEEDKSLNIPGLKVGKQGLEKHFDKRLRGTPGYSAFEVTAKRKIVRELYQVPSVPGEDITLTLDKRLQSYTQEVLSSYESASAVVLDLRTGGILALVSTPSFDLNLFLPGVSHENWQALANNPYFPLINKAISGLYAPGSTVKPFVALAALQLGVIDKNTTIYCPGYMYIGNHKFHCWRKGGHGNVNVSRAITESCDVFFYEVAKKVGIDRLASFYSEIGLGTGGIGDFPQSKSGLVPTKDWKKTKKNATWTISDTIQVSIGQGYMLATPLELALAMARLASGGKKIIPHLEKQADIPPFQDMDYDRQHIETILEAMYNTTNAPNGTAYVWRIPYVGKEMAGKTATTQVRRITLQQRQMGQTKTTHLPWKYREHGLFIGYAPAHDPRYAIAVVVEHAGGASLSTKAARDILSKAQFLETEVLP